MKIALVTNQDNHHKFWAYELYQQHDVRLILLPTATAQGSVLSKMKAKKFDYYGPFWLLMKLLSLGYHQLSRNSFSQDLALKEARYFGAYKEKFKQIPQGMVKEIQTVNSPEAVEMIKEADIDLICFLGGDIARKDFIRSAKVAALNFHSGLSPFYNGNKTMFHAVSDFRPNLAGGTLMYINERIDGGAILSHYLPEINEQDTAADLFLKGIRGAVLLYSNFFHHLQNHPRPCGVRQGRSFKYVRNIDWTYLNDIKLNKVARYKIMKRYTRPADRIDYFDLSENSVADLCARLVQKTLVKNIP
ncbi:MAG: hypothetical protein GVY26_15360 [Bacteroidetes bacterium]|jgi:hypothetical protein|nr:hypothetical protein [Bacteroidota bacterium]